MRRISTMLMAIAGGLCVPEEQIQQAVDRDLSELAGETAPVKKRERCAEVTRRRSKNKAARSARRKGRR